MAPSRLGPIPRGALILATALLGACGGDAPSTDPGSGPSGPAVRAVANPESLPWAETPVWRTVGAPEVEIGVADGNPEYQLYRVEDAAVAADGRILVLNHGTSEVRVYHRSGRYSHTFGGEGEGPGELRAPVRLFLRGDTVTVVDLPNDEEVFLVDGSHLGRSDLAPGALRSRLSRGLFDLQPFPLSDGTHLFFAQRQPTGPPPLGEVSTRAGVILYADHAGRIDTLAEFVFSRSFAFEHHGDRPLGRALFEQPASWHVSWDPFRLTLAEGPDPEIRVFALDAPAVTVMRWNPGDLATTREDRRLKAEEWTEFAESSDGDAWFRGYVARSIQLSEELGLNDAFPAVQAVHSDRAGRVWVLEYRRPTDARDRWRVFDRSGHELGRVALPKDYRVFDIGSDYVLGVATDDLGVERVRLYRLARPEP